MTLAERWGIMCWSALPPRTIPLKVNDMSPARRLAAAALVAVMSVGVVGLTAGPASADWSWGTRVPFGGR